MQFSVVFLVHPSPNFDIHASTIKEKIESLLKKVVENKIDVHVLKLDDNLEEGLRRIAQGYKQTLIIPLLVSRGKHYDKVREIVDRIRQDIVSEVYLAPPMLEQDDFYLLIAANIVKTFREVFQKLASSILFSSTGDLSLLFEIEANRDIDDIIKAAAECKNIVLDDLRVLTYIDTRYLKPGTRVYLEEDIFNFSFAPSSMVVIASKVEPIERVFKLIVEGVKPGLVIATPPCIDEESVQAKRRLLTLDVPVIISSGYKGGVHVAGLILNMLMMTQ